MKILFFINGIYLGGKERRLMELMKQVSTKRDYKFELVVMDNEINYLDDLQKLGVKIHFLIRKTKKDLSVFRKFYQICKAYKPDIIHCWDGMTAIYSIPTCRLLKVKLVNGMIVDAPSKQNLLNKNWVRAKITFPFSNTILGNSKAGLKAYKAPLKKSQHIYNGFNFKRIENMVDRRKIIKDLGINTTRVVGMVATFSNLKDYPTYFKAAEIILNKRKDVTFLAIGNHTDSDACSELIKKDFKENFRLLGKRANVESYINVMDICVLATFTEGISNSILEYMALGKPVVATDGGGTCEILQDQKTGFLVQKSDPVQLAEKIELLLNNSELRNEMGASGKKRVGDVFSIDAMANKFISVYNVALGQKSPSFQTSLL